MIPVPAWSYLYTRRQFPARGIIAWAVLAGNESSSDNRRVFAGQLARLFSISLTNARVLLRRGNGVFWRLTRRRVLLYSRRRLLNAVRQESCVDETALVGVEPDALHSVKQMRAFLAQPTLSRGPTKPVSVATSAALLCRSHRAVTDYRTCLAATGRLLVVPQYERLREHQLNLRAKALGPGEFINKGWVYRRCSDIVVLRNSMGDVISWPVRIQGKLQPRRYFSNAKQLERWIAKGRKVARDAVVKVFDDWVSVANVLRVVRGTYIYEYGDLYPAQNVRVEAAA